MIEVGANLSNIINYPGCSEETVRDLWVRLVLRLWNFWPPFVGAGIAIERLDLAKGYVKVKLKKRPWTANIIHLQFGGSIYAMVDPFYMVLLAIKLGKNYFVIDQSAKIRFLKPGKTALTSEFQVTEDDIAKIRDQLSVGEKLHWERTAVVKDVQGNVVAEVDKVIYIKRRK